jgi:hypothetical protein
MPELMLQRLMQMLQSIHTTAPASQQQWCRTGGILGIQSREDGYRIFFYHNFLKAH